MKKTAVYFVAVLVISVLLVSTVSIFAATTPVAPTISYTPKTPTNGNVTVTVYYPSGAKNKEYRIGSSGVWTKYNNSFTVTANCSVYARYQDSKGVTSAIGGVSITNIDKTPPTNPVISPSTTLLTNQNVTVTVSYSSDSTAKQYKIGSGGVWTSYTGAITISANNTVYAKASDAVGNWTAAVAYTISNIDKTAPVVPTLSADNVNPTNTNVYVTINYSSDSVARQYMIGASGIWQGYTAPVVIDANTVIYAKAQDAAGNWSAEGSLTVSNIDKTAPTAPTLAADSTGPTNQDVNITISYPSDAVVKQYMMGTSGVWLNYTAPIAVSSNMTIFANAQDAAGNWSEESSLVISNIDKLPPANPQISASTDQLTNSDVSISISYSDDSVVRQYKLGSTGVWQDYSAPLVISSNDTVYAKAADNAGNWTSEASYVVSNIDKVAPDAPVITASTTAATSSPVTLSISYSGDSVVKQYKIGADGAWLNYAAPIVLSANATVYARADDAAGNWSSEANFTVTNITPVSTKIVLGYTVKYYSTDKTSYNSMVNNTGALDEIATATYNVDGYGNLTGSAPTEQIDYANNNGIKPNLMVSNNFNSSIAKQLLESTDNRQALINNILNVLQTYNYQGVDIDIENIPAADRDYFTAFMSDVYSTLKPMGYGVTVAVVAKTYDSPNAAWTYGFDYASLANYADYLMIMAYDEHYPGGTPGAIASIGWVTKVVDYALTVVPSDKIVLGLAAYGYDWSSGTTKSYSINNCINLANQYGATINLDSATMSKYFTYTVSGVAHTVWFEDGDTIAAKLDLVNSRDLKGIGIWRLGLENTAYWDTIKAELGR